MSITIQKNIPVPTGRSSGSRGTSDLSEVICALEEGDSFFVPASAYNCSPAVLQRRISVRAVQFRQSGRILYFLITKQTTESWTDDGKEHPPTPGVRVWRRTAEVEK